jgi:hypothetical protein
MSEEQASGTSEQREQHTENVIDKVRPRCDAGADGFVSIKLSSLAEQRGQWRK